MNDIKQISEFKDYLLTRNFATTENVDHFISWVSRFIIFESQLSDTDKPKALQLFLTRLESLQNIAEWQILLASRAIKIYLKLYQPPNTYSAQMPDETPSLEEPDATDIDYILEHLKTAIRFKQFAGNTEQVYLEWARRFLTYCASKNNGTLKDTPTTGEIQDFISLLAEEKKASASTQNQAFNALLFLFRNVFQIDPKELNESVRIKRGQKLPTVLSRQEIQNLLSHMDEKYLLMAHLIYGAGLKLMEFVTLRVKDIDFDEGKIIIRNDKEGTKRTSILPVAVREELKQHLQHVHEIYQKDLASGAGTVFINEEADHTIRNATKEWDWQYVFPSAKLTMDTQANIIMREHIDESSVQKALKRAAVKSGISKPIGVQTLRHSFATHLLMKGVNIREIQQLLGHKSLNSTMVYSHVLKNLSTTPQSPLDDLMATS